MKYFNTSDQFKSRPSLIIMGSVGLLLAYLLVLRAFDTGSWWQYLGTLLLIASGIKLIVRGVKTRK